MNFDAFDVEELRAMLDDPQNTDAEFAAIEAALLRKEARSSTPESAPVWQRPEEPGFEVTGADGPEQWDLSRWLRSAQSRGDAERVAAGAAAPRSKWAENAYDSDAYQVVEPFALGAAQGMSWGFGDEAAGLSGAAGPAVHGLDGSFSNFGDAYVKDRNYARALNERAAKESPWRYNIGKLGGAVAALPIGPARGIAQLAGIGAGAGAASAAGAEGAADSAEVNPLPLKDAAIGVGTGAVAGGIVGGVGAGFGELARRLGFASAGIKPADAAKVAATQRFTDTEKAAREILKNTPAVQPPKTFTNKDIVDRVVEVGGVKNYTQGVKDEFAALRAALETPGLEAELLTKLAELPPNVNLMLRGVLDSAKKGDASALATLTRFLQQDVPGLGRAGADEVITGEAGKMLVDRAMLSDALRGTGSTLRQLAETEQRRGIMSTVENELLAPVAGKLARDAAISPATPGPVQKTLGWLGGMGAAAGGGAVFGPAGAAAGAALGPALTKGASLGRQLTTSENLLRARTAANIGRGGAQLSLGPVIQSDVPRGAFEELSKKWFTSDGMPEETP